MGDILEDIRVLAAKIERTRSLVATEEATKSAFVMPFLAALGYDVFDPAEVTPELVADVGMKRGEKIDYAIHIDGTPVMLIECKHHASSLSLENASQLFRYYAVSECRIGVLTNGIEYRFYTDLDSVNKMDGKPFLVFNLLDFDESLVPSLRKFTKAAFNLEELLSIATELKYTGEIKSLLRSQLTGPSEDFIRFCANGIGVTRMTQAVRDQFKLLTRRALSEFVTESISAKIKNAIDTSVGSPGYQAKVTAEFVEAESKQDRQANIETTQEELEAFYIVKAILREVVDAKRIVHRDQQSYFSILLDDNNRKPICRLRFDGKQKFISLFDEEKNEVRQSIESLDDIYLHAEDLRRRATRYDAQ